MVEKVFISPNRVRAYGNIVNMKTGDDFTLVNSELTVTTDMVDGAEMTVFQFGVEGGISIALVSSASACYVGDNVLLTATVLDDNTPVEAAEVTFKVGETTLGTDETDANGVATYTYAASTVGSFDFTASYQDSTSSVVSVSVNHSYSLSFSQSSYVATGGSATLECTLLEDNVAKSGASITVSGSDGSVYNGITNTNGLASITVSVSSETTFTCTYQNVSATCTVTVAPAYLFYDSGVTGSANTDYTKSNSRIVVSVDSTGTTVSSTAYSDCYYYENVLLQGDFRAEFTIVNVVAYGGIAFLNSSKSKQWALEYNLTVSPYGLEYASPSDFIYQDTTMGKTIRVERIGTTLNIYVDGSLISTKTVTSADGYIGWKTHKDRNRSVTFKDFSIISL